MSLFFSVALVVMFAVAVAAFVFALADDSSLFPFAVVVAAFFFCRCFCLLSVL